MPLTQRQGAAVLAKLSASYAAVRSSVETQRQADTTGIKHGLLSLVGADHDSQWGGVQTLVDTTGRAIDQLRSTLDDATSGDDDAATKWQALASAVDGDLAALPGYSTDASVTDTVGRTADATATAVKDGVNTVAVGALKFGFGVLPWWVIVGGLGAVGWYALRVKRVLG